MQIQPTILRSPQTYSSNASSKNSTTVNISPNAAVEGVNQVERGKKIQGLETRQIESLGSNSDEDNAVTNALVSEPMTAELLSARLDAKLEYEQALQGSEGAVGEYLANENAAAREEIQQMVGIDTYA